jgi:hypothetical protein
MNRVQYLQSALEINEVQADLLSDLISDIPNDKLKEFLVFRMNYIQPMMSKELITKTALFDFKRNMIEAKLRAGVKVFEDIYAVKDFLLNFYRGKEIANGAGDYFDFVVIAMDKDGELINKYKQNEHGTYKKLNNDEVGTVLNWLYQKQHRIGVAEHVPYFDPFRENPKQLENSQAAKLLELVKEDEKISPKMSSMLDGLTQKVKVSA